MFDLIPEILLYLFAFYGIVSLIASITESINRGKKFKNPGVKQVILLKDQQDTAEGIIKAMLSEKVSKAIVSDGKLYIVDMGSHDETLHILKRLKRKYENIEIFNVDEKEQIFHIH
ncbi:MAG TPA: hypothetical protein PK566_02385 [Pseudobacteroides sp.]|nr:hypothetical protein [Pseudobacteroides sp.]